MIYQLETIRKIYESSFPPDERRDFNHLVDTFDTHKEVEIKLFEVNNTVVGFIIYWTFTEFIYIEHFAVDSIFRGKGSGARILEHFLESTALPVILEVELPSDDISIRRINFYRRLGFILHDDDYIQPPYSPDKKPLKMFIMSYNKFSEPIHLDKMIKTIYHNVYDNYMPKNSIL